MRILHTSDWHLGKYLENQDRLPEQKDTLDEICRIAKERNIHLVLIAGDIFDTYVPSAAAEELFYDTVERLSDHGKRGVIIIAGNHDSPDRLCAAKPLADRNGIILLGMPGSQASVIQNSKTAVKIINSGQGWMELAIDGLDESAVVITLPYPSEARLEEVLADAPDEELMQKAYAEKVGRIFDDLAVHFRADTVNLAMSHLFIAGGESSDSERPIQLGGALTVGADKLPGNAHYVALGHLHKPQKAAGAKIPAYYSGSLLSYSFSETGYQKAVFIVEAHPGQEAKTEKVPLMSGKPLVKWVAENGPAEVTEWLREGKDGNAWIDLEVHVDKPLSPEEVKTIRTLGPGIINIRPVLKDPDFETKIVENRSSKPLHELFEDFYRTKTGVTPKKELTAYFLEIAVTEEER